VKGLCGGRGFAPSRPAMTRSEFVQPIERRHLISFRQRRIVEHRVAKIFDRGSHRQHRLPNL
jgi:hypothetical protein